jgi:glycosyltransferase involved in cell wall biosynthesis
MKVLHIVSSLSRNAGGPARSVQGLVAGLNAAGVDAWLMAMKPLGDPWVEGVDGKYRCAGKKNWFGMQKAVERVIDELKPDILHIHSIWQWTLHLAVRAAQKKGVPYVLAPRGTIEEWSLKQKWLKKKIALLTYQGSDFRHSAAIHCTADSEANQARKMWPDKLIILSPNAVNAPKDLPKQRLHEEGFRRALFLSRFHYKKGLLNLVEAWAKVRPQGWKMELVGTDGGGYLNTVKARIQELRLSDDFIISGGLMDDDKWKAYRRSDLFVLPSYSENFGIVVAEALWAGVPVITTKGTPWKELGDRKCGWWIDIGIDPLVNALKEALALSDIERREMGGRGRKLIEEKYTWDAVVKVMVKGYESILK